MKKRKYGNKKITVNGITYDSKKEYLRHRELLLLERAGAITDLQTQVPFELIPAQFKKIPTGEVYKRGDKAGQPKMKRVCLEQSVKYIADFVYFENGVKVVEDVKSDTTRTKDYILKRKLMLYINKIIIKET